MSSGVGITLSWSLPVIGEFRVNRPASDAVNPLEETQSQIPNQEGSVEQDNLSVPLDVLPQPDGVPVSPSRTSAMALPQSAEALAPTQATLPTETSDQSNVDGEHQKKEQIPESIKAAEADNHADDGAASKDGGESEERTSVDKFTEAAPSIRSQLQQPELVKSSLASSPAPSSVAMNDREETSISVPMQPSVAVSHEEAAFSPAAPTSPAVSAHRVVPALQEIQRAKVEESVTLYPELSSKWAGLTSLLVPMESEKETGLIQSRLKTLLEILIPAFSDATQKVYLLQLEELHQDILQMFSTEQWSQEDTLTALCHLKISLEEITKNANEEIESILGSTSHKDTSGFQVRLKNESSATEQEPRGWGRRHRNKRH